MKALQQPCPGCPTLTWVLEGDAVCYDCGCTLRAYRDVEQRQFELVNAARTLPKRLRSLPTLFAFLAQAHPLIRPPLSADELRRLERFRQALSHLWAFDEEP
jgi:hypothetical protein